MTFQLSTAIEQRLKASPSEIAEFCQRWNIIELALFGSILRDDFRSDSDIDILASFSPDCCWNLFDLMQIQEQLANPKSRELLCHSKTCLKTANSLARIPTHRKHPKWNPASRMPCLRRKIHRNPCPTKTHPPASKMFPPLTHRQACPRKTHLLQTPKENCPKGKSKAASERDIVCITVTGSPEGVRETLLTLYRLGFAEFNDWSPAQRAVNPQQVMSVLIRRRKRKA
ncbi:MAG: nucleotidyltransferase family protein [Microcoleus sp.]